MSLHDLGSAVIRSGPLAWTICLGTLVVGFITLLNVTGLGLAVLRLRRRVRGWFAKRLGLRLPEPTLPLVSSPPQPFSFVAADSRSTIAGRTPHRRGPPALLVNA
ncbi:hypothetical protein [Raineyella sp. LH-20]|uniref:hypothetical protein n=1 Tax=Raineyella sp. LH-20 TaxID=3081204 RepID=UPI0029549DD8|nr:hypothetical protein [Raineyella sp. LH-20]WOP18661.1 hypothetical protein R0146_15915 [Raineyella sp. LH-20]